MSERADIRRECLRRAKTGFPWGIVLVYLVFVIGNAFSIPAPSGGNLLVVSQAMAESCGSPVTAALVQMLWSGLLGAVIWTAEVPFLLERGTLLWSGVHFLATAAAFSLAGWQCRWFPEETMWDTWRFLLLVLLLFYLLRWSVRFLGWQADIQAIRRAAGLEEADPPWKTLAPYLLLAAAVEVLAPAATLFADPMDFWVLAGFFYPYLVLPFFCFLSAFAVSGRLPRRWLVYPAACALFTLPSVFLIYNSSALFFTGVAGVAALAGGLLGAVLRRLKKKN